MKKNNKKTAAFFPLLTYGGLVFVVVTVLVWIIYFFDSITMTFIKDDISNALFSRGIGTLFFIISASIALYAFVLLLSKNIHLKVVGLFILLLPVSGWIMRLIPQNNPSSAQLDFMFWFQSVTSAIVALFTYIGAPVYFAVAFRIFSKSMLIILISTFVLWISVLFTHIRIEDVLGTRYGGVNMLDVYLSLINVPFLVFILQLPLLAREKKLL